MKKPLKESRYKTFVRNKELLLLTIPAIAYFIVFNYLPMPGIIIAFTDYKYSTGIFGSEWVGLKWFEIFFKSDLKRVTINTVRYGIIFIFSGVISGLFTAILLNFLKSRASLKVYQTVMILPNFMSWVVVALILYIFLDPLYGIVNRTLLSMGKEDVMWYSDPKYWPYILTFMYIWKGVGMGSVTYFAAIMGIDSSLFEAATIDGSGKMGQVRHIILPELVPLIIISIILSMGGIMRGDFGMFYSLTRNVGMLYPATDILDTFIFRGLSGGRMSFTAAAGFYQSFVGFFMVLVVNFIVKKMQPDHTLF